MKKIKNNNVVYAGILFLLILIYVGIKFSNISPESNFDSNSLAVDTTTVTKMFISSQAEPNGVYIEKVNGKWIVKNDSLQADADENTIYSMLSELANLKIESIVATSKEKWEEYEVTDSSATEIKVFDKDNNLLKNLFIGKFRFKRAETPYGAGTNGTPYTFVRTNENDNVYLVKGMLSITFNRNFNNLRNQMICKIVKSQVNNIEFIMAGDTGYSLTKKDSIWFINNKDTANLDKVESYLNSVAWLTDSHFDDKFKPKNDPIYIVTFRGNEMMPITIRFYQKDSLNYVVNSSYNPNSYFVTLKENLVNRLIKSKNYFLKNE